MKSKSRLCSLRLAALAILLASFLSVPLGAEETRWTGEFTLPFEVHWGNSQLSAGNYKFTITTIKERTSPQMAQITIRGQGRVESLFAYRVSNCHNDHTALLVANSSPRNVYTLHLANQVLYYGTERLEKWLAASGVAASGCCHTVCCQRGTQGGHATHAAVFQSIPVRLSGK